MDNNSLATAAITAAIVAVLGGVYKLFHHCRFRSSCCGREVKVDSNLSPPAPKEAFDVSKKNIVV